MRNAITQTKHTCTKIKVKPDSEQVISCEYCKPKSVTQSVA